MWRSITVTRVQFMLSWWNSPGRETVSKWLWSKIQNLSKFILKRVIATSSWRSTIRRLNPLKLGWRSILKINCVNKEYKRHKWPFIPVAIKRINNKEPKEPCKILKFNKSYKLLKLEMLSQTCKEILKSSTIFSKTPILLKSSKSLFRLVSSELDELSRFV